MPPRTHPPSGHPIQVVSRRTGLTPEVLRIWEKRYGVVHPSRSATGRRLYSEGDIERLRLLREITLAGRRISDVASLSLGALETLAAEDRRGARSAPRAATRGEGVAKAFLETALDAVERLDDGALDGTLERARLVLTARALIEELLAPLLHEIGRSWEAGRLHPFEEHFASACIRRLLLGMIPATSPDVAAPVLVAATPAGQRHELGALMAAATASAEGWRVTYLGADLPARDIARAAGRKHARAVALSIVHPAGDPGLIRELSQLRTLLPDTPLLLGGGAAAAYREALGSLGALFLEDTEGLGDTLRGLAPAASTEP